MTSVVFSAVDVQTAVAVIRRNSEDNVWITGVITAEDSRDIIAALETNTVLQYIRLGCSFGSSAIIADPVPLFCAMSRLRGVSFYSLTYGGDIEAALRSLIGPGSLVDWLHVDASYVVTSAVLAAMENTAVPNIHLRHGVCERPSENGDKLACQLANVIRQNSAIQKIDAGLNMTAHGAAAIAEAMKMNTTLNSLTIGGIPESSTADYVHMLDTNRTLLRLIVYTSIYSVRVSTGKLVDDIASVLTENRIIHWLDLSILVDEDTTSTGVEQLCDVVKLSSLNHFSLFERVVVPNSHSQYVSQAEAYANRLAHAVAVAGSTQVCMTEQLETLLSAVIDSGRLNTGEKIFLPYLCKLLEETIIRCPQNVAAVKEIITLPDVVAAAARANGDALERLRAQLLAAEIELDDDGNNDNSSDNDNHQLADILGGFPYSTSAAAGGVPRFIDCTYSDSGERAPIRRAVDSAVLFQHLSQLGDGTAIALPCTQADADIVLQTDENSVKQLLMAEWQRTLRRLLTLANYVHASAALNVLVREYVRTTGN
jgi:hypothetical protein